jgi:hypothetical protein
MFQRVEMAGFSLSPSLQAGASLAVMARAERETVSSEAAKFARKHKSRSRNGQLSVFFGADRIPLRYLARMSISSLTDE